MAGRQRYVRWCEVGENEAVARPEQLVGAVGPDELDPVVAVHR
jgi:hypothetical protein